MNVLEVVVVKMKMKMGCCGWCFCCSDSFFFVFQWIGVFGEGGVLTYNPIILMKANTAKCP